MTVPARLAAFVVVLALAFGAGALIGEIAGPIDTGTPSMEH